MPVPDWRDFSTWPTDPDTNRADVPSRVRWWLDPKGDTVWSRASRRAMRAYADEVAPAFAQTADFLRRWADREERAASPDPTPGDASPDSPE